MKKSLFYITIAILAMIVMFSIQLFSVLRIFSLSEERFDYEYREIITEGIGKLESIIPGVSYNKAYNSLENNISYLLNNYHKGDPSSIHALPKAYFGTVHKELVKMQGLESVIKKLLQSEEIDTDFKTHFKITELSFYVYPDTVAIYDEIVNKDWDYADTLKIPEGAIQVSSEAYQGDYVGIKFDAFVDFTEKRRLIIGQMAGILIVMALALSLVVAVFIITLRNMLEENRLSQLKTDFINNMTHELKTPLSTIAIATKTLEKPAILGEKDKSLPMVHMIGRQNRYLSRQINHLLEVSMWEKGQFELEKKEFELKPFLQSIAEAFRWECKTKNLTLLESYDGIDDLKVRWDETQMTMAIHNILVNGTKYNNGIPEISIKAFMGHTLNIEIADNGIGISHDQQKHIFDKFYRVHTGNIHKVKGLGLGLFYVKQIVEAHQGEVTIKSKINSGSKFIIKIPYHG